ncbi:Glucosamine-6-phosphate deaminase [Paenibacillus pasadenensis]|uniref:Glucosamine-6-phosphate deaminase n=1 Tax=Paenibacillus pasadenensis TaxID=217090 RepID=A0A2N5N4Z5_9BACL|nr:glucosamine-6-phosphate deaminase [Paenibacillus pasadenensis]PLT45426.1 Glucosamine-6-phosphate deaminase [Paenibacillus pasadenensis]
MQTIIESDYEALSERASEWIAKCVSDKPDAVLCLAAGATPVGAFRKLVSMAREGKVDLSKCRFVGLDEWAGLGREDEGSCKRLLYEEIFEPLQIPEDQLYMFDACSEDLAGQCQAMNRRIETLGGIDFMLVGAGMNGHIGFNEPGTSFDTYAHVANLDEVTQQVGQKYFTKPMRLRTGVTLGLRHLAESRSVVLMVSGSHKADIVERIVNEGISEQLPASLVRKHPNGCLLLDSEAAVKARKD